MSKVAAFTTFLEITLLQKLFNDLSCGAGSLKRYASSREWVTSTVIGWIRSYLWEGLI